MWNGSSVQFSAHCGVTSPRVTNSALLKIPGPGGDLDALYEPSTARHVVKAMVEAFDPEWLSFRTNAQARAQGGPAGAPVIGWLT